MKNVNAVELGRLGGRAGGPARARALSAERRSEIARNAVLARWSRDRPAGMRTAQQRVEVVRATMSARGPVKDRLVRVATDRLYRRQIARRIARRTGLDEGDIEHALFNMTLSPIERLSRGLACRP